jgi:hypothetical protein
VPGNPKSFYSSASLGISNGGPSVGLNGTTDTTFVTGTALVPGKSSVPDTIYVFDAVLQVEHTQEMQVTEHPVQTGANIVDHAFAKPARIVMDIGMSDVMSSYILGQWTGAASKSVNAYQTLLALEVARTPVTINTRLKKYSNMLLTSIHVKDDNKTKFGLRATLVFQQLFMAVLNTQSSEWSSRPNDTSQYIGGITPTTPIPQIVGSNYFVTPPPIGTPVTTGAGNFGSNPIGS